MHERGSIGCGDVPDGPRDLAARVEGDDGPVVVTLHEPGADDLGDDLGWHGAEPTRAHPRTRHRPRTADCCPSLDSRPGDVSRLT